MFPSGGYRVTEIENGQLIQRRYFDYTKREAVRLFKDEVKELAYE
jgi:hypothetical protein